MSTPLSAEGNTLGNLGAQTKGRAMSNADWRYNVSNSLVRDKSVSALARFTYIVLMGFEDKDGTAPAFPELETLEWILGRDREAVQRYTGELERAEWITKEKFKNKSGQFQSVRYRLLRHRSGKIPLRQPQRQKPATEKPATENAATITSQSNHFPILSSPRGKGVTPPHSGDKKSQPKLYPREIEAKRQAIKEEIAAIKADDHNFVYLAVSEGGKQLKPQLKEKVKQLRGRDEELRKQLCE